MVSVNPGLTPRAVAPSVRAGLLLCLVAALLPSAWLAWRFRTMPQFGAYHDDAVYMVTAKALAEGNGYRILSLPEKPFQTKYPPLLPLLLSIVWRLDSGFPGNLSKITAVCWSLLPVYLFLVFRLLRQWRLSTVEATGICVLAALSPHVVLSGLMTMSELLFGVFVVAALLLLERGMQKPSVAVFAAAGAAAGLAFLTRTQGLALLASAAFVLVWRKRSISAAVFSAVFGSFVVGWWLWTHTHAYAGSDPVTVYYIDYVRFYRASVHWSEVPLLIQTNLDSMFTGAARLLFATTGSNLPSRMFSWVVAMAVISGIRRTVVRSGQLHFALFALASFVMFIPWNWPPNERYLLPLWPAIATGFYFELRHLLDLCRANFKLDVPQRVVASAMCLIAVAACAAVVYNNFRGILLDLPAVLENFQRISDARRPGYEWLRQHSPADAQILTYDDPLMYLYSGRRGYAMPIVHWLTYASTTGQREAYFKTAADFMQEHKLSYALVTAGDFRRDLQEDGRRAFVNALHDRSVFEEQFNSAGTGVFKLKPRLNVTLSARGTWWAGVRDSIPAVR
jgi:hypothetical protein